MKNLKMRTILIPLILLSGFAAAGQPRQVFAYLQNDKGKSALKPGAAYKYDVAKAVFDDLLRTRGDIRQQAPELVMNDGERFVAWMDPVNVQIGLEEKAYDICASLGADSLNALAALLAHELTHYYEKHDWSRNFVHNNQSLEAARQIQSIEEGVKQETQADCLGGFLAFSAGYNVFNLMPGLLERLYKSYGLPEALPGYPSLSDRLEFAGNAMEELSDLLTVFEIAQYLSFLENFEEAAQYYRFILQSFQSREIYNNAGANLVLAALSQCTMSEMPFVLPIELDPDSRLHNLKGLQADRLAKRKTMLDQALEQFDRAISMDPGYALAYLNKASAYALSGDWDDAVYWLKKGKKVDRGELELDFMVLEGILAGLQKDSDVARLTWEQAQGKGSLLASVNLDILNEAPREIAKIPASRTVETIDKIAIDDFLQSPSVEKEIKIGKNIICGIKTLPNSQIMVHYADDGRKYTVVQLCDAGCEDTTKKGIGVGSASADVTAAYGSPPRVVAQPGGLVWVYPNFELFFRMSNKGAVQSWGAYRNSNS
jgi:tetratricopeptide (TPR) repeat protein